MEEETLKNYPHEAVKVLGTDGSNVGKPHVINCYMPWEGLGVS